MVIHEKSDVLAKIEYKQILKSEGYKNIHITKSPSDIQADKNEKHYYFEIKFTSKEKNYFGAATLTEWECAIKNPETYYFVIAVQKNNTWIFTKYLPKELMKFSNVPPFKINFIIPNTLVKSTFETKKTKSIIFTHTVLNKLSELFEWFRKNNKQRY